MKEKEELALQLKDLIFNKINLYTLQQFISLSLEASTIDSHDSPILLFVECKP